MSAPELLPAPGPALTVHQAAARIRSVAEKALADLNSDDFWSGYDRATAWRDGFENGMGGVCSQLAGLFTPELAIQFADWLDTVASHNARYGTPLPEFALTTARALTP
ncbi:hypothetical protein OOK27_05220 [Streptomyces canus]|uniref:hypothetical protein n=1 Tax=Streptomyces canus TaxID=58343 RepID=UPI00225125F4|nr:hypothetical protein [Streptomyces canus]MCX5253573.1 hypothetical protein [Streptomyces canus]